MAGILSLRRWEPASCEIGGVQVNMLMKRLTRTERRELSKLVTGIFEDLEDAKGEADGVEPTRGQKLAAIEKVYAKIPEDDLRKWIGTCVKGVTGIELDGEPQTTGEQLLEIADDLALFWMLLKLNQLSKLTGGESNASASPSGSEPAAPAPDGSSPAGSTASEAGREPSTATETPASSESSIAPV